MNRASGRSHRRTRRRWLLVGGVAAAILVWAGVVAFLVFESRRAVDAGMDGLEGLRSDLTATSVVQGEGIEELRAAGDDFARAHDLVTNPLLVPARALPIVGRQVRSVDALTAAAEEVVEIGSAAMEASSAELVAPVPPGVGRVELTERLGTIAAESGAALDAVDLGPGEALVGPLDRARERFSGELGELEDALDDVAAASTGLVQLLRGPSTYLVLAANNAEMRAGSGMLLSAGLLTFENGTFALGPMTPVETLLLPEGLVEVSGDYGDRWGWSRPGEDFRQLALSPAFDVTAQLAARMWEARTGVAVDGVVALDPVALRSLLAATGPVEVDGELVSADTVVGEILLDQYLEFPPDLDPEQQARRDRLSGIARAAVAALDSSDWDAATLVEELRVAADGRHILAWSERAEQQAAWEATGIDGELTESSLMVSVLNRGGNKLDQFLATDPVVTTTPGEEGTLVEIAVRLTNSTPEGLPTYVAGPYAGTGLAYGQYRGILSVTVPGSATGVTIDAGAPLVAAGADGPTVIAATYVEVAQGESQDHVVRFTLPRGADEMRMLPSARVPPESWRNAGEQWTDEAARTVRW